MRQTTVKTSGKGAKHCSLCGAKTWLFDAMQQVWSGPWHFNWCESRSGNKELANRNAIEELRYAEEKVVPREIGGRVLTALNLLLSTPKLPDGKPSPVYYIRKAAILEEIKKL